MKHAATIAQSATGQTLEVDQSNNALLDLISTSQTKDKKKARKNDKSDRNIYDACVNNAPHFAYQVEGKKWGIVQGCCNDWNCPRCGQHRAREEYYRIVQGSENIGSNHELYMLTVTCRGREVSVDHAEQNYLAWTNRFLTRLRTACKRDNKQWFYAGVTERQTRGHPHSHYITTYCPDDAVFIPKGGKKNYVIPCVTDVASHDTLQSAWLERASFECGLGYIYDISAIKSKEAASRYVAKYLFKDSVFATIWPKGWRRVRYSQNWPKVEREKTESIVLLSSADWHSLLMVATKLVTQDGGVRDKARSIIGYTGIEIQ